MTALCNHPEAFAFDLGDDQSRYLYYNVVIVWFCLSNWLQISSPKWPVTCRVGR